MKRLAVNRLLMGLVGLVVVTALGFSYLFSQVLKTPVTDRPHQVRVELVRTGGLFEGSPATYRGVRIGTVTDISLASGQVEAVVELRPGAEVPRDTEARVRSLSPVGEQYLDFRPRSQAGPFLADGDVVEADATDVPVAVASAADELIGLVEAVDERDLRVLLRETSLAVDGSAADLESLLTSTSEISGALDSAWPQTRRLLRNGATVGELIRRHNDDLTRFSADAERLARFLRDYDPRFRRLLATSPRDLDMIGLLADDLRAVLPPFLAAMVRLTDVTWKREPHLRALPDALRRGSGSFADAFRDGWLHIKLNLQGQQQCSYGVERRETTATERHAPHLDGHCAMDDRVWRGAEHAPPPLDR